MFRWKTAVMTGQWRRTHRSALTDALRAGQAEMVDSDILLFEFVEIEQRDLHAAEPADYFKRAA